MYPNFGVIILAKWNEVTHYHRKPKVGPVQSEIIRALKSKQPKKITEKFIDEFPVPFVCMFFSRFCMLLSQYSSIPFTFLLNFSNRFIGIISLERLFSSSIANTMNYFQNSVSHLNLFSNKAYRNQNFMVTKDTNSKRLWIRLIMLISFEK